MFTEEDRRYLSTILVIALPCAGGASVYFFLKGAYGFSAFLAVCFIMPLVYWRPNRTDLPRWLKALSPEERVGWFILPTFVSAAIAYSAGWQPFDWLLSLSCAGIVGYLRGWSVSERYTYSLICLENCYPSFRVTQDDVDRAREHLEAAHASLDLPHLPYCPCSQCRPPE